ncbi:MAG: Zn-ribbon domain-containing OB-fold protein [Natronomonas sp.]
MDEYPHPLPTLDDEVAETFWQAAAEERLLYQTCEECGEAQFFPRSWCQYCGSTAIVWRESSGEGHVHTFTVVRRATELPSFSADVPYVVAYVELQEGVRICSNVVDCPPETVEMGMDVSVTFDHVTNDVALPKFRPAE